MADRNRELVAEEDKTTAVVTVAPRGQLRIHPGTN